MKIGLALGGGGARSLAHIGVLRFLEEENVKISSISGTSMGALVGALYALRHNADYVERIIKEQFDKYKKDVLSLKIYGSRSSIEGKNLFLEKPFRFVKDIYLWNLRIVKPYLVHPRPFFRIFRNILRNYKFKDCEINFLCVAVDIIKGEALVITEGPLFKGVAASCALPGVFPPLNTKYGLLVDGGVLAPLPAGYLKNDTDFVIGVSVEDDLKSSRSIKSSIDMLFTVDRIRYRKIVSDNKKESDFLICPPVSQYSWSDFDKIDEIINAGYVEAKRRRDSLMKAIGKAHWLSFLGLRRKPHCAPAP